MWARTRVRVPACCVSVPEGLAYWLLVSGLVCIGYLHVFVCLSLLCSFCVCIAMHVCLPCYRIEWSFVNTNIEI